MPPKIQKKCRIGIIGCGAIGSNLAFEIRRHFAASAEIAWLCDHHADRIHRLQKALGTSARQGTIQQLIQGSDLIIEAASVQTVHELLAFSGIEKKQVLLMSVGGLIGPSARLQSILKKMQGRLYVPAGAIAGVDGLLASREAGVKKVVLRTRKPPKGLEHAAYFKTHAFPVLRGREEKCVFKGSAARAIESFPQNVNVAAVLSLAGIGADKTRVEIWTSRAYTKNCHEIEITSAAGTIRIEVQNRPYAENPKTSALAMYSALAVLRQIFSPLHIGA